MQAWKLGWRYFVATLAIVASATGIWNLPLGVHASWVITAVVLLLSLVLVAPPARVAVLSSVRWFSQLPERLEKGDKHDQVLRVAAVWQVRAEEAEEKLGAWHVDSVFEGRRRAFGEFQAAFAGTTFGPAHMSLDEGRLVLGADVVAGDRPAPGLIFMLRDETFHSVRATLRVIGYAPSGAALFLIDDQVSPTHVEHLVQLAGTDSIVPPGLEIAPRAITDNFASEG